MFSARLLPCEPVDAFGSAATCLLSIGGSEAGQVTALQRALLYLANFL